MSSNRRAKRQATRDAIKAAAELAVEEELLSQRIRYEMLSPDQKRQIERDLEWAFLAGTGAPQWNGD